MAVQTVSQKHGQRYGHPKSKQCGNTEDGRGRSSKEQERVMGSGRRQAGEEPGRETEGVEGKTGATNEHSVRKGSKGKWCQEAIQHGVQGGQFSV